MRVPDAAIVLNGLSGNDIAQNRYSFQKSTDPADKNILVVWTGGQSAFSVSTAPYRGLRTSAEILPACALRVPCNHLRHTGRQFLCIGDMQELVWAVRIRLWTEHAGDQKL